MLSFLARSALCIGVVAAAAEGLQPGRLAAGVGSEARRALGGAEDACLASAGCLRAAAAALSAATDIPAAAPPSAGQAPRAAAPRPADRTVPRRTAGAGG